MKRGKVMNRKWVAFGIIFLFIGTCLIPAFAKNVEKSQSESRGEVFYVGGSGPGNYTRIQDAINDSSNGDAIYVYNGTYYENVQINKAIILLGQNRYGTIIDGRGVSDVVHISAESATIRGFTVRGAGPSTREVCAGIKVDAMDVKIYNNIIVNNSDYGIAHGGVYWRESSTDISNNIIKNNRLYGIRLLWHHNWIFGNTISENQGGIVLMWNSEDNMIKSNTITDNTGNGIVLYGDSNTVLLNTVQGNDGGIQVSYCSLNTIQNNIIMNNNDNGIVLEMYWDKEEIAFSLHNNITGNVISGHSYGIIVGENCDYNIIFRNNITKNIHGFYAAISNNNSIEQNNFIDNTKSAHFKTHRKYDITFTQNYWDDLHGASKKTIIGKQALFPLLPSALFPFYWFFIPCLKFDIVPAKQPYIIGGK